MTKKKSPTKPTTTLRFKTEGERQRFHDAAEQEGFTTLNAWMMFHLRAQVRKTLGDDRENVNKGR